MFSWEVAKKLEYKLLHWGFFDPSGKVIYPKYKQTPVNFVYFSFWASQYLKYMYFFSYFCGKNNYKIRVLHIKRSIKSNKSEEAVNFDIKQYFLGQNRLNNYNKL